MNFKIQNYYKIIFYILIFCLGLLFMLTNDKKSLFEPFGLNNNCPNILIQKGTDIYLFNSKLARIPGRNPIRFNNLNEYIQFLNWERSQNINCPILFLQHSYDAQGNVIYKQRNSIFEFEGGTPPIATFGENNDKSMLLNATRNNIPFNKNLFPGFDPDNQYVGLETPLSTIKSETMNGKSADPMDHNWGGANFTKSLIDKGYYKDNEVKIQVA